VRNRGCSCSWSRSGLFSKVGEHIPLELPLNGWSDYKGQLQQAPTFLPACRPTLEKIDETLKQCTRTLDLSVVKPSRRFVSFDPYAGATFPKSCESLER